MAILVAPVVVQLSMLVEPELMLVGLAVKAVIAGFVPVLVVTVTVTVAVVEPEAFVAVKV